MTRRASSRRSSKRRRSTRRSSKHRSSRGLRANEKSESRKAAEFRIMMSLHRDDPDYSKQIAQMRSGGDLEAVGLLEDLAAKNAVHRANYALFDKTVEPYIGHGLAFNRTNEDGVQVITVRLNEATTRPIVTLRVSASGRVTSVAVDKELLRYARSGGSVEDKLAVVERILADHAQPNSRSSKRLRANSVSRSHLKSYPKNKGYEDATWKWALTAFPLEKRRIVVTAWRAREGVGKDRSLEQVFDGDAKGLKVAKAYARLLVADAVAVVADVKGEVYLDGYWPKPWGGTWSYEWVSVEELASFED